MTLWWIGNVVLLVIVVPLVVYIANRVIRPVREIDLYAKDILEHGVAITGNLDPVPALGRTKELTAATLTGVARYGAALDDIL
jgi:hypothetical protein